MSLAHRSNHTVVTAACLAGRSHCAALGDDRSAPRRARDHNSRLSHEWTIPAPTARHPSSQRFSPRSQRSRNSVVGVTKGWIVARADQPWPGAAATTSSDRDPQGSGFPRQRHYGSRDSSGRHELQAAGYADARACWPPPAACRAAASYTGRRTVSGSITRSGLGQPSGLGTSLSGLLRRLPGRAPPARLSDDAGPA